MRIDVIHRASHIGLLVLSLAVFGLVLVGAADAALNGFPPPDPDEGVLAHLFQLAVVALVPISAAYGVSADWNAPWPVARRLVVPVTLVVLAFATLRYFEQHRVL